MLALMKGKLKASVMVQYNLKIVMQGRIKSN